MIVYSETNFVLELLYRQPEVAAIEEILAFALRGAVQLAIPAVSIVEADSTVLRRQIERRDLMKNMNNYINQLNRRDYLRQRLQGIEPMHISLTDLDRGENDSLKDTLEILFDTARIIDINKSTYRLARDFLDRFNMKGMDHLVLSSILSDLHSRGTAEEKVFVTRDREFSTDPDVRTELHNYNCRVFGRFDHCLAYIKSQEQ